METNSLQGGSLAPPLGVNSQPRGTLLHPSSSSIPPAGDNQTADTRQVPAASAKPSTGYTKKSSFEGQVFIVISDDDEPSTHPPTLPHTENPPFTGTPSENPPAKLSPPHELPFEEPPTEDMPAEESHVEAHLAKEPEFNASDAENDDSDSSSHGSWNELRDCIENSSGIETNQEIYVDPLLRDYLVDLGRCEILKAESVKALRVELGRIFRIQFGKNLECTAATYACDERHFQLFGTHRIKKNDLKAHIARLTPELPSDQPKSAPNRKRIIVIPQDEPHKSRKVEPRCSPPERSGPSPPSNPVLRPTTPQVPGTHKMMVQCSFNNLRRVCLKRSTIKSLLEAVQMLQSKVTLRDKDTKLLLSSLHTCYVRLQYSNRAPGVHGHFSAYCPFMIRGIEHETRGAQPLLLIGPEGSGATAQISECSDKVLVEKDVEILNWIIEIGSPIGEVSRTGLQSTFKPLQLQHMQDAARRRVIIYDIIKAAKENDIQFLERKVLAWCKDLEGKFIKNGLKFETYEKQRAKESAMKLNPMEFSVA